MIATTVHDCTPLTQSEPRLTWGSITLPSRDAVRVAFTLPSDDVLTDYPNGDVHHSQACDHVSAADQCIGGCGVYVDVHPATF